MTVLTGAFHECLALSNARRFTPNVILRTFREAFLTSGERCMEIVHTKSLPLATVEDRESFRRRDDSAPDPDGGAKKRVSFPRSHLHPRRDMRELLPKPLTNFPDFERITVTVHPISRRGEQAQAIVFRPTLTLSFRMTQLLPGETPFPGKKGTGNNPILSP